MHSHPNGPNWFSVVDFEEFANKAENMRVDGATKPILDVLVSPIGLRCVVFALALSTRNGRDDIATYRTHIRGIVWTGTIGV